MRLDGHQDLVASIASSTNHIRIENVHDGSLLDWIKDSGLTQEECALIQPSYATIEDYRRDRPWQDEVARLQQHFAKVEQTLLNDSHRSLCKVLIAKVDEQLRRNPNDPALSVTALSNALRSDEPSVRIAAAYAIAQVSKPSRETRLVALSNYLSDSDPYVRFWTAVAVETMGAASPRGKTELHHRTLPVFLDTYRNGPDDLRLAALIQLASVAPETMGTNRQFRIIPEIRQAMVSACGNGNHDVHSFANGILNSWRWQRTVYESQRIPRHYLAASADLEALASETLALDREFAEQTRSLENLTAVRSIYDSANSITYMLPVATETAPPIADSADEAEQIVDEHFQSTYEQYRNQTESPWPFWEIVSVDTDTQGLYYVVVARRTDSSLPSKLIYILPRPSMLSAANMPPHSWFERVNPPNLDPRPSSVTPPVQILKPNANASIEFGDKARNNEQAFAAACDVFASFMTHYAQVFIDREVQETPKTFTWSGRFARLRQYSPRFFEQGGGGSSVYGGGGWDFQRIGFECDRRTGKVSLSAEPIEYPVAQLPADVLSPEWATKELKLMGWKPLESLDYFGQTLFPPEYQEGIDAFDPNDASRSRQILYRRYHIENALPRSEFMLGLLYDQEGHRDKAIQQMTEAAGRSQYDPQTLASVARWQLEVGRYTDARKNAESALRLWPEHPEANKVIKRLDEGQLKK
jgi:tetratricopeptide (TPR) repeat protein